MLILNFIKSSIGKKSIMSLTGLLLGLFLLVHLLGNMTVFLGRQTFISYAEHLHSLGRVIYLFEFGLLSIFIIHIIFALTLFFQNISARPQRYMVKKNSGGRTLGSMSMPYTGLIILAFIILHLKTFHFSSGKMTVADLVRNNFNSFSMTFLYVICLSALIIHTSHGFWSIFQTVGINHPKYNKFISSSSYYLSIVGGLIFILIPLITIIYSDFLL